MTEYILISVLGLLLHWVLKIIAAEATCKSLGKEFFLSMFLVDNKYRMLASVISLCSLMLFVNYNYVLNEIVEDLPKIFRFDMLTFFGIGYLNSSIIFGLMKIFKAKLNSKE